MTNLFSKLLLCFVSSILTCVYFSLVLCRNNNNDFVFPEKMAISWSRVRIFYKSILDSYSSSFMENTEKVHYYEPNNCWLKRRHCVLRSCVSSLSRVSSFKVGEVVKCFSCELHPLLMLKCRRRLTNIKCQSHISLSGHNLKN